jgi:hypothetical protein
MESKDNDIVKTYLDTYYDLCYLLSNNIVDKQHFDLLSFLEQISNNFDVYCNIKLLFTALNKDIHKLIQFKHFIVYLGRLIKGFNVANKSNKSLFTLEQLKIEHKVSIIRENLMYFIQKSLPDYQEQAQSKMYYSFDEEVECAILKTFIYSVEIEKIENAQRDKKRKIIDIGDDLSPISITKPKLSHVDNNDSEKIIDVDTHEINNDANI